MTRAPQNTLADVLLSLEGEQELIRCCVAGQPDVSISGSALLDNAMCRAADLIEQGVRPGDRVLLMLTSQAEFIDAFFGVSWAGAIPVPLYPPLFSRKPRDFIENFGKISEAAGAKLMVVSDDIADLADLLGNGVHVVPISSLNGNGAHRQAKSVIAPDDIALLQYTSGSTGTPKGVALSHSNLLANMRAIGDAVKLGSDDVGISWLPLYHDMGLIGVLATLCRGGRVIIHSPLDFAKEPAMWLRSISEHRGTLSPAPNFAFDRCLRLPDDELDGIDLSSWRVAFNGSEPVRPETVRGFTRRFAAYGFRHNALYPVYGLAEHTLAVSFPSLDEGPSVDTVDRQRLSQRGLAVSATPLFGDTVSFVSVGTPLDGVNVEIRGTDGNVVPEASVGEIVVRSDSVMTGYFGDPAATDEALADGWLRTGDLGYLRAGKLYVTGRIKDLIIRAGRNYYPDDIERAVSSVDGVRAGRAAAISSATDESEEVIVLAESDIDGNAEQAKLKHCIAAAVADRVGFRPERVEICRRDTLPITSSGKVRRRVARQRYLKGCSRLEVFRASPEPE